MDRNVDREPAGPRKTWKRPEELGALAAIALIITLPLVVLLLDERLVAGLVVSSTPAEPGAAAELRVASLFAGERILTPGPGVDRVGGGRWVVARVADGAGGPAVRRRGSAEVDVLFSFPLLPAAIAGSPAGADRVLMGCLAAYPRVTVFLAALLLLGGYLWPRMAGGLFCALLLAFACWNLAVLAYMEEAIRRVDGFTLAVVAFLGAVLGWLACLRLKLPGDLFSRLTLLAVLLFLEPIAEATLDWPVAFTRIVAVGTVLFVPWLGIGLTAGLLFALSASPASATYANAVVLASCVPAYLLDRVGGSSSLLARLGLWLRPAGAKDSRGEVPLAALVKP